MKIRIEVIRNSWEATKGEIEFRFEPDAPGVLVEVFLPGKEESFFAQKGDLIALARAIGE